MALDLQAGVVLLPFNDPEQAFGLIEMFATESSLTF